MTNGRLKWTVPADWQVSIYALEPNHGLYSDADADLMNARGMSEFIASTHAQYLRQLQQALNIPITGTFTDEPHISSFRSYVTNGTDCRFLPWTSELPTSNERKNYDVRTRLPCCFMTVAARPRRCAPTSGKWPDGYFKNCFGPDPRLR